jgi:hypothetical protein
MKLFITKLIFKKEYKVSLILLWLTLVSLLAIVILGFSENGWSLEDKLYMACNSEPKCFNTFYGSNSCNELKYSSTPLCIMEYVPYGFTYGEAPSFIFKNSNALSIALLGVFLFLNTILFNKDFLKDFKVEV